LSAAVSDMLGGSVTNDLCNYANGKITTYSQGRSVSNVILCGVLYFRHIFAFVYE